MKKLFEIDNFSINNKFCFGRNLLIRESKGNLYALNLKGDIIHSCIFETFIPINECYFNPEYGCVIFKCCIGLWYSWDFKDIDIIDYKKFYDFVYEFDNICWILKSEWRHLQYLVSDKHIIYNTKSKVKIDLGDIVFAHILSKYSVLIINKQGYVFIKDTMPNASLLLLLASESPKSIFYKEEFPKDMLKLIFFELEYLV